MGILALTSILIFVSFALVRLDLPSLSKINLPSPSKPSNQNNHENFSGNDEISIQTIDPLPPAATSAPTALDSPSGSGSMPFSIHDRVAAIVETRPLTSLIPLIVHFASVLGPAWPIVLFTAPSTVETYTSSASLSAPFQRLVALGRISLVPLPTTAHFDSSEHVSMFLASKWFWQQLEPAEHVLLFQSDSIICSNSPMKVEDFFEWDFIGAPIAPQWGSGFNGGLSLRNATLSRYIVNNFDFESENKPLEPQNRVEDQWFHRKMSELGGKIPTDEVALKFSVETVWGEEPLGYHQILRWNKDRLDKVEQWCPEYRLATSETIAAGSGEAGHKNGS